MKSLFVAAVLLLVSTQLHGEPQPWMRKKNPETLHFVAVVDSTCPLSTTEVTEIINGILIRSRLRPGDIYAGSEIFGFGVVIGCLRKNAGATYIYNIETKFVRFMFSRALLESLPNYQILGSGPRDAVEESIRASVEYLVTDYLQANFDLTPE